MTTTGVESPTRFRIGDLNIFVRSDAHELIDDFAALCPGSTRAEPGRGRTIRMDVRKVGGRRLRRPWSFAHQRRRPSGVTRKPLIERHLQDADTIDQIRGIHAIGHWGGPAEIATEILFLASDDASFITGTTLMVDGGWTAGRPL